MQEELLENKMVSRGPAQFSCKVRIHPGIKEQPQETFLVNILFVRIAEKLLLTLTLRSSTQNSLAIDLLVTLIPIRDQDKRTLERLY